MKILMLSTNVFPEISGDSIFSANLLQNLNKIHEVELISMVDDLNIDINKSKFDRVNFNFVKREKGYANIFSKFFRNGSIAVENNKDFSKLIKSKIRNNIFDFIIIDHLRSSMLFFNDYDLNDSKTKIIYVAHNIEKTNLDQKIYFTKNIFKKIFLRILNFRLNKIEKYTLKKCNFLWCLSPLDLKYLNIYKKPSLVLKTKFNFPKIKNLNHKYKKTKNILMLGSMQWYPNEIAAKKFTSEIFPEILKKDKDYKLFLVGNSPSKIVQKLNNQNVEVTGFVNSTNNYISKCDIIIIYDIFGTGIKIKFYEAIYKGIPALIFTTKEKLDLYKLVPREMIFIVEDNTQNDKIAEKIININNNIKLKINALNNIRDSLENINNSDLIDFFQNVNVK